MAVYQDGKVAICHGKQLLAGRKGAFCGEVCIKRACCECSLKCKSGMRKTSPVGEWVLMRPCLRPWHPACQVCRCNLVLFVDPLWLSVSLFAKLSPPFCPMFSRGAFPVTMPGDTHSHADTAVDTTQEHNRQQTLTSTGRAHKKC